MNRFQPISFQDLDDLFEFIPDEELQLVKVLRNLVYDCIPEVQEKLSYNVPFFRLKRNICFIWPGSVPWGGTFEGVQFGFIQGHLLSHDGYLETGKRKYVRTKIFKKPQEIEFDKMSALLFEALEIDQKT